MLDVKLYLNSVAYSDRSLDLNFENIQFSNVYSMFKTFLDSFSGNGSSYISVMDFKRVCPLIVFNNLRIPLEVKSVPTVYDLKLVLTKMLKPLHQRINLS